MEARFRVMLNSNLPVGWMLFRTKLRPLTSSVYLVAALRKVTWSIWAFSMRGGAAFFMAWQHAKDCLEKRGIAMISKNAIPIKRS